MSFNSLDKVRSLFTLCSKLGERERERDFCLFFFQANATPEAKKKGSSCGDRLSPLFFTGTRTNLNTLNIDPGHWLSESSSYQSFFLRYDRINKLRFSRYRTAILFVQKSKLLSLNFHPSLICKCIRASAQEGLNDRWALHFLPLSFFLLLHLLLYIVNIDTQYTSISIIHFHKEHRKLATLAKPIPFFSSYTSLLYPPSPPIEDLRRKFIDDEISFCPVPIPSFLFTLFLFLDPAQRALNHPHRMDTRTRICACTCVHSEARMYACIASTSLSLHVFIYTRSYIYSNTGSRGLWCSDSQPYVPTSSFSANNSNPLIHPWILYTFCQRFPFLKSFAPPSQLSSYINLQSWTILGN